MKTTVAEYSNEDELIKNYVELLVIEKTRAGSRESRENIIMQLKYEYQSFALKEGKSERELWLADAKKCYNETYESLKEYINSQKKLKYKEHHDYKIPLDLYNATQADFEVGKVDQAVKEGNLFIKGASDTGKSHLAVAILREHVARKPDLKIEMFFEDDFHEMTYEESQKEIKRLKTLDGVVFDDLGAIGMGIDKRNLIKGLIYSQFRNKKLCIICTNCVIDDLYDSRTGSKIIGACTVVNKKPTGTRKQNKKEIEI